MSAPMTMAFSLAVDPFGKLVVSLADGTQHVGAVVARAFPIATPDHCISILSAEGKELAWVENLNDLPANERDIVAQALQGREFMPEILRLDGVNSFSTPSIWRVQTSRGPAQCPGSHARRRSTGGCNGWPACRPRRSPARSGRGSSG